MAARIPDPEERNLYATILEIRDVETSGGGPYTHLEGRAVPYDTWANVGWYLEQHAKDSLKQSTTGGTGKTLPLLLFHDHRSFPIGGSVEWRSDSDGLYGVWVLNDRPEAQEAARLAKSGELGYMSIGFLPIRSNWDWAEEWQPELGPDHMDKVTRLESRLLEVSVVSTPAFADAEVTLVRHKLARGARAEGMAVPARPGTPHLDAWRRERARLVR